MFIRDVELKDSRAMWEIRNLEQVRLVSNDTEPIPLETHERWFKTFMENTNHRTLVLEVENQVVGYCRVIDGLVSIALRPEAQGKGYGRRLLGEAVRESLRRWPSLQAIVRKGNEASLKLFLGARFSIIQEDEEKYTLALTQGQERD